MLINLYIGLYILFGLLASITTHAYWLMKNSNPEHYRFEGEEILIFLAGVFWPFYLLSLFIFLISVGVAAAFKPAYMYMVMGLTCTLLYAAALKIITPKQ